MDSFVAWGQAYGLYVTIAMLVVMYIFQSIENSRLKRNLGIMRNERTFYKSHYIALGGDKDYKYDDPHSERK